MAQRTVFDCDLCGKRDVQARKLSLKTGESRMPSGEKTPDYTEYDLCERCGAEVDRMLVSRFVFLDFNQALQAVRWVEAEKKKRKSGDFSPV